MCVDDFAPTHVLHVCRNSCVDERERPRTNTHFFVALFQNVDFPYVSPNSLNCNESYAYHNDVGDSLAGVSMARCKAAATR